MVLMTLDYVHRAHSRRDRRRVLIELVGDSK